MEFIKKILKEILPPIFLKFFKKKLLSTGMWSGEFQSWEDANKYTSGYNQENILLQCKESLLKVKCGEFPYERDSVLFNKVYYSLGLVAVLLKAAIENKLSLNVLDFGGSLGSTYYQNLFFLEGIDTKWTIVEQEHFVSCGIHFFQNDNLKFQYSLTEHLENNKTDVLVLSSVLQYLQDPIFFIELFNKMNVKYILIDRTPFTVDKTEFVTIQNVDDSIYAASYPTWCFSKQNLISNFSNFCTISDFPSFCDPDNLVNGHLVKWEGIMLKNKNL